MTAVYTQDENLCTDEVTHITRKKGVKKVYKRDFIIKHNKQGKYSIMETSITGEHQCRRNSNSLSRLDTFPTAQAAIAYLSFHEDKIL